MTRGECIRAAQREYRAQREENERALEARTRAAIAADPAIGRLMADNAARIDYGVRQVLIDGSGAHALSQEIRAQIAENQRAIRARLCALGMPEDALSMPYRCPQCHDTGYDTDDQTHFCPCFEKRVLEIQFADQQAQTSGTFDAFDERIFPTDAQRAQALRAKNIACAYAESFPGNAKRNLMLAGASGLGKTFLLDAIAHRIAARGYPTLRVTGFRMLEAMRAYHFGENGNGNAFAQMIECPMLLIDDLGTEPILRNITVEYLFMLLNERLSTMRHTVVATNMTPAQLLERYGERVASRLLDRSAGQFIRLEGQDLRLYRVPHVEKIDKE